MMSSYSLPVKRKRILLFIILLSGFLASALFQTGGDEIFKHVRRGNFGNSGAQPLIVP